MPYRTLLVGLAFVPLMWSPAVGQSWAQKLGAKSRDAAERAKTTAATQGPRVLKYTKDMATARAQNWTANRPQREAALRQAADQAGDAARRVGAGLSNGARGPAASARDFKRGWEQRTQELNRRRPRPNP